MAENYQKIKAAFMKCSGNSLTLPLFARAHESKKMNSILMDEKAVMIAESIDHIAGPFIQRNNDLSHYALIFRSICFDRLIKDFIWRHPSGTIINIGCGLDTTFERLNAGSVKWYDLDLPEVIELRKMFIEETENRRFIASSFLKNEWLREIDFDDSVLVFANAVFYYYCENTIRKFFAKLSFTFPSFEMLFNVTSPAGVRAANRVISKAGIKEACLKWGIKDYRSILGWNPRMVFLGSYKIFHMEETRLPLKHLIQGMISDALSIEQILHFRIRYNYRSL